MAEDLRVSKNLRAVTITLPPRYYKFTPVEQFRHTMPDIQMYLKDNFHFVAELTEAMNVHYHGYVKYTKAMVQRLIKLRKHYPFICVKRIKPVLDLTTSKTTVRKGIAGWHWYCHKSTAVTRLHGFDPVVDPTGMNDVLHMLCACIRKRVAGTGPRKVAGC